MTNTIIYFFDENILSKKLQAKRMNKILKPIGFQYIKEYLSYDDNLKFDVFKNIKDPKVRFDLKIFECTLKNNFDKEDLKNFEFNIKWLNLKFKRIYFSNIFCISKTLGNYDQQRNKLYLEKDYDISSFFHELFHLASTNFKKSKLGTGFSYYIGNKSIGRALNEGYTEYLTQKYFKVENGETIYCAERKIAECIEKIVGVNDMKSLYLNSDLLGLFKALNKYYTNEELEQFLISTDAILFYTETGNMSLYEYNKISELYNKNIYFLLKGYCQVLSKSEDKSNMKNNIIDFINTLTSSAEYETINVDFDINIINYIINEYLGIKDLINEDEIKRTTSFYRI